MRHRIAYLAVLCSTAVLAQQPKTHSRLDDDGTVYLFEQTVPYSILASPESKQNLIENLRGRERLAASPHKEPLTQTERLLRARRRLDEQIVVPGLLRLRQTFAVEIEPQVISGVQTDVVTPKAGIPSRNRNRVLMNLHGGGFAFQARYGGQAEVTSISSIGGFKVITVDYRQGPENKFPAASEDVAKVYQALLNEYRPENIGIYGCSAGGMLTAQSMAWFQTHGLPRPGAIGIFDAGGLVAMRGDSNYIAAALTGLSAEPSNPKLFLPYFDDPALDLDSVLVSPAFHASVLAKFPPTLLVTGTRDMGLSPAVFTHARLLDAGAEASLYVVEGGRHCSYASLFVDANVPENRQTWRVITRFFDKQLGSLPK